jgi:hypothetical protein
MLRLSSSTVGRDTVSLSFTAFEDTVIDHYTNGVGAQHEIPRQQGMDASKKDAGAKCRPEAFVQPLATNEGVEARHTAFSVAPGTTPLHFSQLRQSMLAQLVSHSGGIPQVLNLTPRGSEFQAEDKKIPSLALCAKALVVRRPRSA